MSGRDYDVRDLLCFVVREFRAWQVLLRLTVEERRLLMDCDMSGLIELGQMKSETLFHLKNCRQRRVQIAPGLTVPPTYNPDGGEEGRATGGVLQDEALCLYGILEGIQMLAWRVGELSRGNYALADCSARRLWSLQSAMYLWTQGETQIKLPILLAEMAADRTTIAQFEEYESL